MPPSITFTATLWLWNAEKGSWHFLTVPQEYTDVIKMFQVQTRGFGSVPVRVTIGKSTWKTSVFPNSKEGTFLLPVKASVRKREHLTVETPFSINIQLLDA